MAIIEEKINDFFNDEEKVKALIEDEEFMDNVSGGTATPGMYREKLRDCGVELTAKESEICQKSVVKVMDTPTEELDDKFLEDISGGLDSSPQNVASGIALGVGAGAAVAGLGCYIASVVYTRRANKRIAELLKKNGGKVLPSDAKELEELEKLGNKIDKIDKATAGLFIGATPLIVGGILGRGIKPKKQ